jgi:hypothetical protein
MMVMKLLMKMKAECMYVEVGVVIEMKWVMVRAVQ